MIKIHGICIKIHVFIILKTTTLFPKWGKIFHWLPLEVTIDERQKLYSENL